ncbi:hypothetical protein AtNW77_Chr1g0027931 [Arabidopsis thaliana]|nr:UDP-3-O-acyl N-acetylglycosamine deacetylase family protein [Arabidopsis thaliana]AEE30568.1 UDP-3-O-acyl N-acetylglycosamine deacetylase family protein [Arabidopsis thaliana]|eukprot:NP_001185088.1 UDP-3-O-acyl N-acetylglycosamine deacetylase family protein [Arabidopsis thaliana]
MLQIRIKKAKSAIRSHLFIGKDLALLLEIISDPAFYPIEVCKSKYPPTSVPHGFSAKDPPSLNFSVHHNVPIIIKPVQASGDPNIVEVDSIFASGGSTCVSPRIAVLIKAVVNSVKSLYFNR